MATVRRPAPPPVRQGMQRPRPGPQQLGTPASAPAPDRLQPGDPRFLAGGGPFGESNAYYASGKHYGERRYTDAEEQARIATAAAEQANPPTGTAGHARYDPELFALWRQQHPNDPRQYAGPGALPEAEQKKIYAKKGREMWQQAVVHQANQPNSGQGPMPQGGLSRTTPGIPAGDDPIWAQRGQQWYQQQGAPFGGGTAAPEATARQPVGTPGPGAAGRTPTGQRRLPFSNEQLTPRFAKMKPGEKVTLGDGKTYFKNQNGAVVDITDPRAKKRITDRQGNFVGQAAAPPPGAPAAAPPTPRQPIGAQPPPTTPGGPIQRPVDQPPPTMPINPSQAEYPPTNQPPYQYDPYSMNQFGYPQGQGPGPYGWNPGYGGPPFNYSNFGNALMQGMGGGYGWPEQNMGGYGWPEAQMMGGYAGLQMNPYAQGDFGMNAGDMRGGIDFGSDPNMMGQGMMGYY